MNCQLKGIMDGNTSLWTDDKLYVPIGAPCNICNHEEDNPLFATLTKMNADGSEHEIVAKGIRNTVGFTWHPETGNIWFTDNGRDWLGDDIPPCELNEITGEDQHFGYPYLHGNDVWDPKFGEDGKPMADRFKTPVQELGAHVAPLGVIFYTGNMFPTSYKTEHLLQNMVVGIAVQKSDIKFLRLFLMMKAILQSINHSLQAGWTERKT